MSCALNQPTMPDTGCLRLRTPPARPARRGGPVLKGRRKHTEFSVRGQFSDECKSPTHEQGNGGWNHRLTMFLVPLVLIRFNGLVSIMLMLDRAGSHLTELWKALVKISAAMSAVLQ